MRILSAHHKINLRFYILKIYVVDFRNQWFNDVQVSLKNGFNSS
jgi:hypothetical protein